MLLCGKYGNYGVKCQSGATKIENSTVNIINGKYLFIITIGGRNNVYFKKEMGRHGKKND